MPTPYTTPRITTEPNAFTRLLSNLQSSFALPAGRTGRLLRPRHPRKIAGVCSGLAEFLGWDISLLRVLVALSALFSFGFTVLLYAAAWVLIPEGTYALPPRAGGFRS